jgi:hypothetical protein
MDPNLMSQMFNDPQMMNSMQEMMKNPDFMDNAMKMMNNPEISKMFGGLGGDNGSTEVDECEGCDDCENTNEPIEIERTFSCDDIVSLSGLKSEEYNGKQGIVREYLNDRERYSVYIEEMDKTISLREENLTLVSEETDSIENVD